MAGLTSMQQHVAVASTRSSICMPTTQRPARHRTIPAALAASAASAPIAHPSASTFQARAHRSFSSTIRTSQPRRLHAAAPLAAAGAAAQADDARDFAIAMAKVADDTKCQDIVVLHVEPLVSWTSYMVIVTVYSRPQLLAVLARVEKAAMEEFGREKQNLPGSSPWEAMDFGDVLVHIFTEEQRELYAIESFYAQAEDIELPFIPSNGSSKEPKAWTKASQL